MRVIIILLLIIIITVVKIRRKNLKRIKFFDQKVDVCKSLIYDKPSFKETYSESRDLFLKNVRGADKILNFTLPFYPTLQITMAVFEGSKENLLLHISGTHGVEGYVGAAIQNNFLQNYIHKKPGFFKNKTRPTVIFIHALNPFGMSYYRRANENNVDLNRNALFTEQEWTEALDRDPNIAGYEDLNHVINPKYQKYLSRLHLSVMSIYKVLTLGLYNVKRSMVTGTYSNYHGLFFGGHRTAVSHDYVRKHLEYMGYLETVKNLVLIDVHSGLGPTGKDTIMVGKSSTVPIEEIKDIFSGSFRIVETHESQTSVTRGYELTMGDVSDNYPKLFKNLKKSISVTQEFGTYNSISVGLALIEENQQWFQGGYHEQEYLKTKNRMLLEIFCPNDPYFRKNVLKRGTSVIEKSLNFFSDKSKI
jgi:hypothetical protein